MRGIHFESFVINKSNNYDVCFEFFLVHVKQKFCC